MKKNLAKGYVLRVFFSLNRNLEQQRRGKSAVMY